jgi:hypothetical protein
VSLKKPSELFGKNNDQKKGIETNLPENLIAYKSNLKNIETLNEFAENFGSFSDNVTKINTLEEGIRELKEELKNTLTQEDLDNAVMSNLLILEKNIDNIQKSLKGINRENLKNIYEEVETISNQVLLVTEELPRYKNLIKSNEVSLDKKLIQYQESVNEHLTDFDIFIENKFETIEQSIENSIEGINESALNKITTNVKNIEKLVNTEIPRHKKQVTEKVIEIDEKFSSYQKNIENYQEQIQLKIQEVQQSFETLFENEVPKYQSLLANAKIENDKKVESIVNKLTHKIKALAENTLKLNEELEDKSNVLDQSFETKISALESYILNVKKEAEETTQTYRKLYQVIEAKGLSDRSQFDTYEKAISHISEQFSSVYEKIEETKKEIEKKELYQEELNNIQEGFNQKFIQIETLIENKNQKLKEANEVLVDNIVSLKEEVSKISVSELHQNYHQISRKVNHIEEVFNKFNEKTILNEGLLNEPPTVKTSDPLTPLDQKFVTLDQLQEHYRTFINRIQQQLSTLGGGGETRLEFLDDVDRNSAKTDGYVLSYQASTGKFIGTSISGGGSASQWVSTSAGIHTLSNVGIGTTNPTEALFVVGNAVFTGNVSVAGTVTYDDVTNVDSIGFVTARSGLLVGTATTFTEDLVVEGDARVTGILTVGTASITIDGNNNTITSGQVTISGSSITLGDNVVINAGASGINSAPNVLYVAKDGSNDNNGTSIDNAKLTIAGAVSIAQSGTTIKVLSGTYIENNPIILPEQVSVVGDSLREVTITPQNSGDIFYVTNGNYVSNVSFVGAANTGAVIAFNPSGSGNITQSPYIQNCTNFIPNSVGVRVNGAHASGDTKSIVVDSYTQYNQGGIGVSITNNGYAQLVSLFTICNDIAIYCGSGGACDLTNSNSSFGNYGLVADGVSNEQYVGVITTPATANSSTFVVAGVGTNRPFDGQIVYFDDLYYEINKITITNGGSNYTSAPTLTIDEPTTDWGIAAQAVTTVSNGVVTEIDIISSGRGYTTTPSITIAGGGGGSGLTLSLETRPKYYSIESATLPSLGISTITINENLPYAVGVGTTVPFFKQSRILASGHSFEYIGSGVTIATALPSTGGVSIQENEIDMRNGGLVVYTSTDQSGNFRIGDGVTINQTTGDISGSAYTRSLYANVTPLILALGA